MLQAYNGACCIFIMVRKQDLLNLMGGRLKDTDTHQKLKEAFQASLLPLRGRFYESKNYKTKETKHKAGGFRGHAVTCGMRRGARHGASAINRAYTTQRVHRKGSDKVAYAHPARSSLSRRADCSSVAR